MSFPLALFVLLLAVLVCLALGYACGYHDGHDDGWEDGYDFAASTQEVRWRITAEGNTALAAQPPAREQLAELHVHPMFLAPESHPPSNS